MRGGVGGNWGGSGRVGGIREAAFIVINKVPVLYWQFYGSVFILGLSVVCQFQGLLLMVSMINLINQEK